jgi:hypothetical protein
MSRYAADLASAARLATLPAALPMLIDLESRRARHVHRDRDAAFGIGYGSSSGYGLERQYVSDWGPRRFKFM